MMALSDDDHTRMLTALGRRLGKPQAVLCVSAHWLTKGSWVTGMAQPRTIHDFGGFPEALYAQRYPAPGSPALAALVRETLGGDCGVDEGDWGLDHGAWTVLKFLYPDADVPVVQLSVDYGAPPRRHLEIGAKLRALRDQGVLIMGSGDVVHNLRRSVFSDTAEPYDWAVEFDEWVKARLRAKDYGALAGDLDKVPSSELAVPTTDHYDPMLYVLGAADREDALRIEYEGIAYGALSLLTFSLGAV
jgi:4,5-DOPA dioxygenase extradiol